MYVHMCIYLFTVLQLDLLLKNEFLLFKNYKEKKIKINNETEFQNRLLRQL